MKHANKGAWYLIADVDRHAEIKWIWSLKNQNPGIWSFSLIAVIQILIAVIVEKF